MLNYRQLKRKRVVRVKGKILKTVVNFIPGCVCCVIIALLAQFLSRFVPAVGAALIAIGLGILCGNTVLNREVLSKGTKFSESRLLEYSIVLMGLTLSLSDMLQVGWQGVLFVFLQMSLTITAVYLLGRWLRFGRKFSLLMCAGNAVCGSSAIGTIAPVIGADAKDKGISITIVNVTGTVFMVLLPLFSGLLYQHAVLPTSAMVGGQLQSIGQVIASAKLISEPVVELSTVFKLIRILFLVGVAFVFSRMNTKEEGGLFDKKADKEDAERPQKKKFSCGVPWFIIGFFLLSILNSTGVVPMAVSSLSKAVSGQFEIIALAAIGMRVKFRDLIREGPKALLYGGMVGTVQTLLAMGLIALFF